MHVQLHVYTSLNATDSLRCTQQYTATHCSSVLQCVAVCCSVLQCVAEWWSALQSVVRAACCISTYAIPAISAAVPHAIIPIFVANSLCIRDVCHTHGCIMTHTGQMHAIHVNVIIAHSWRGHRTFLDEPNRTHTHTHTYALPRTHPHKHTHDHTTSTLTHEYFNDLQTLG